MTQEDKELLLTDLSARLPYGVICYGVTKDTDEDGNYIDEEVTDTLCELHIYKCCYGLVGLMNKCNIESIKPYLRPMSSMTEEEKREYNNLCFEEEREMFEFGEWVTRVYYHDTVESIDWLNKKHFDYRGLIEKGLALAALEGMYK